MRFQMQADLFISRRDELAIDTTFGTANRTMLDTGSWIEVVPGWLSGSDNEPRLTAEYRDIRDVPHRPLVDLAAALSKHYGVRYDSFWLNLYRDGRDSTGWHRDRFSCRRPLCVVPVLTLGATRRFLLKPRHGGPSIAFTPRSGDLIVMGGRCQEDWLHGVPKTTEALGPRISVNFQSSAQARR